MPSVGTVLRQARLTQAATLEDISARTRILLKNLQAIESDQLPEFSSPFIYRSFVRQFADELKLDWSTLAPAVQAASSTMPQPRVPGEDDQPIVRVPRLRPHVRRDFRWILPAASMLALIAVGSGSYAARRHLGPHGLPPFLARFFESANSTAPAPIQTPAPVSAARQPAAQSMGQPAEPDNGIHIRLSAIEPSWLSIAADGKQTYAGVLAASETKSLVGRETARIRTGNAGGLTIVFNGKSLGALGLRGQTRTVLFTTSGYEVVESVAQALKPVIFLPARFNASPVRSASLVRLNGNVE